MKTRKKFLALILCSVFLFSVTGMALAAPPDGYYVNGHRYDLTLSAADAGYSSYLDDMAAINFDFTKVIIVSANQYATVQAAVNKGSISDVLQPGADQQVGKGLPGSVIPIANDGTVGPSETIGDTGDELVLESIAITKTPNKIVYNVGEELDITGLEVTGSYDDGSSKVLLVTKSNITGFDSSAAAASQTLTVTVEGKTAEYTIEIKEQTTDPVTAVSLIENAIANFKPANATGKFGGEVLKVKVVGDVAVRKCDFITDLTSINAAKVQTATMTVNIYPQVQPTDKDVKTANFPFAEIISGAGIGADAVAGGVVTQDADFYYIQLTNADCPTSVLNIIDAAGNVSSGTKMNFTEQKANCKIKVSKATGLVVSVDEVTITGKTNVTKSTMNLANGTYNNTFWNNEGPITYTYN